MKPSLCLTVTNPVLSLDAEKKRIQMPLDPVGTQQRLLVWLKEMEERGARFPKEIASEFYHLVDDVKLKATISPRIVGLLVDHDSEPGSPIGLVTPLKSKKSTRGWNVGHSLPFHAGHIQDALIRLLSDSCQIDNKIPELVSFELTERLNEPTSGTSMHIAGLLSVVDAFNNCSSPVFQCACAVVEPVDEELRAVGSIETKLKAFVREYQRGSLLVRHPDCEKSGAFDAYFEHVWQVRSFADLGQEILNAGQMTRVLSSFPVTLATVGAAKQRIRWLQDDHKNFEALQFAERLQLANDSTHNPLLRVSQSIQALLEDLNRHNGRYAQAILHSRKAVEQVESLAGLSSFNELVDAKVRLAAALFDGHDFSAAIEHLLPLIERVEKDEGLITAESQINLYNTMGRVKSQFGHEGWEPWFHKSLELQKQVDPDCIPRTTSYLVHGLLHHRRHDDAIQLIDEVIGRDPFTDSFLKFYKADWYRRVGKSAWVDPDFESNGRGYVFGFYLQATARQTGMNRSASVERLRRSAREMCSEIPVHSDMNILQLFAYFTLLAAAVIDKDISETESILDGIHSFMNEPKALQIKKWYSGRIPPKPQTAAELSSLFEAVPYF